MMIIHSRHRMFAQAMVEFLIILPVLMLLVLGILQFGFIYQTKITLNYAAFEVARAASLNNLSRNAMENAFARTMAAVYTHDSGATDFIEARQVVRQQIADGYVYIDVVNPGVESFNDHGLFTDHDGDGDSEVVIPNDNLMYRDAAVASESQQTIQDANLVKVNVGYCYELYVPFVNRIIWMMQRYGPSNPPPGASGSYGRRYGDDNEIPGFFGPPPSGSFAESCITFPTESGRYSIVMYAQSIMRMHSPPIFCEIDDSC